jgi:DNA modification methylase
VNAPVLDAYGITVYHSPCLPVIRSLPDNSLDAVICDPPYGLANTTRLDVETTVRHWLDGTPEGRGYMPTGRGFMGHEWDAFVPAPDVWDETFRAMKPGAFLIAFAGSRTYDLMGLSIRLAGFTILPGLFWLYAQGKPAGQHVALQIDAMLTTGKANSRALAEANAARPGEGREVSALPNNGILGSKVEGTRTTNDEPMTDEARFWHDWHTQLKGSVEPMVVAQKPISEKTIAANVLRWGTGAFNIGATRVPIPGKPDQLGRFTPNVIVDDWAAAELDKQAPSTGAAAPASGPTQTGPSKSAARNPFKGTDAPAVYHGDEGGAGRFYPRVGEESAERRYSDRGGTNFAMLPGRRLDAVSPGLNFPRVPFIYQAKPSDAEKPVVVNDEGEDVEHSTVKALELMRKIIRMVVPPGGKIADWYAGTGTTGHAALLEGVACILTEQEADYVPLIHERLVGSGGQAKTHSPDLFSMDAG